MTESGEKRFFECHFKSCCCQAYILLDISKPNSFSLFRCTDEHQHEPPAQVGIHSDIQNELKTLLSLGLKKPNSLIDALKAKNVAQPRINQLNNWLAYHKRSVNGPVSISVSISLFIILV